MFRWSISNEGADYVPCKTPVIVSITIGQIRISPHPLNMSLQPSNNPSSVSCIGIIQADPSLDQGKQPGDIILGVAFLRNVYVVHGLSSADSVSCKPLYRANEVTKVKLI